MTLALEWARSTRRMSGLGACGAQLYAPTGDPRGFQGELRSSCQSGLLRIGARGEGPHSLCEMPRGESGLLIIRVLKPC